MCLLLQEEVIGQQRGICVSSSATAWLVHDLCMWARWLVHVLYMQARLAAGAALGRRLILGHDDAAAAGTTTDDITRLLAAMHACYIGRVMNS